MFKISKHIFAIFLISTIIPLLILFVVQNYNMFNDMQNKENFFLDRGLIQLQQATDEYLQNETEVTNNIIKKIPQNPLSDNEYKNYFGAEEVYFINSDSNKTGYNFTNIKNTKSFYDLGVINQKEKPSLRIITIAPLRLKNKKFILIVKKVDFNKLYPRGPFNLEIYAGQNIDKHNLLLKIDDNFAPSTFSNTKSQSLNTPPKESPNFKAIKLLNPSGETVSTLVLKINSFPPPPITVLLQIIGFIGLIIAILASFFIGSYIKQNFIIPFLLISETSKKVQNGDFSSGINYISKNSETNQTINRFNKMIEGLKEKEELRSSFISGLTHDLRTPLIANQRVIEYILDEFKTLNLQEQYNLTKGLYSNNEHLLRMVNLLLESYHFDATQVKIYPINVNLSDLFEECIENIKSLAEGKNINIENVITNNPEIIKTDKISLKRVLINLLANAIESIEEGSKIILSATSNDNYTKIFVEDNGPGVAILEQKYLFEKYYSGKSEQRKLGYGLGLYICKKLVELNNGQIDIDSTLGEYTRFTISFPKINERF